MKAVVMTLRHCESCGALKPFDKSVKYGPSRGFHGHFCWDCFSERYHARKREEHEARQHGKAVRKGCDFQPLIGAWNAEIQRPRRV